ncbi:SpaA isopeptide-forming pilin-related protein [Gordonibacter sp.]|uniref:SpaA isopeptide-forming pilin-related protein n=1 Tax=Gordonibacter sp. TaxID=1968902 RepID=UPI002FCBCA69
MFHRKARLSKILSVFMAVALVMTCNSATFQPMALAFGDSLSNAISDAGEHAANSRAGEGVFASDPLMGEPKEGIDFFEDASSATGVLQMPSLPGEAVLGNAGDSSEGGTAGLDSGSQSGESSTPTVREPVDLTADTAALSIGLYSAAYQDAEGAQVEVKAYENALDLAAYIPGSSAHLELRYHITLAANAESSDAAWAAGDWFVLTLPQGVFTLDGERLAEANLSDATLVSYAAKDEGLVGTLSATATAPQKPLELTVRIPVVLEIGALSDESSQVELNLQGDAKAVVTLPARPVKQELKAASPSLAAKASADTTSVALEKEWRDNNDPDRPWKEISNDGTLAVWFTPAGKAEQKLDTTTMGQLGLTKVPAIEAASAGMSHTSYTCKDLPMQDVSGASVSYTIKEAPSSAKAKGYVQQFDASNKLYNIRASSFAAEVKIRDGEVNADPGANAFHLYRVLGDGTMEEVLDTVPRWVFDSTTGMGTYKVASLAQYDLDGKEIVYCMKAPVPADTTQDYYFPEYDNKKVPNYGTNVTECYSGGTVNLTRAGTAEYEGTKVWLDPEGTDAFSRPDATMYLWRYTERDNNGFAQASQVRDEGNQLISLDIPKDVSPYTFTIKAGGTKKAALPKYDPEGYPYVYLMRETLSGGGYEQVFGAVSENADGSFSVADTLAPGVVKREPADRSLYNGGTLSNRITDSIETSTQKTWKASVYQNKLKDVVVTMTLQSRPAGSLDDSLWKNTDTTQEMTGFIAEVMTKTAHATPPRYDALGRELEYRWVETSVVEGGVEKLNADGTFKLDCNPPDIDEPANELRDVEWFASSAENVNGVDDTQGTWTVNRLIGVVDYTVDKLWRALDENGQPVVDSEGKPVYGKEPPKAGASITVGIYQNGTLMKDRQYTMDGTPDADNREMSPYHIYLNDLPKYDSEGRAYSYTADEVASSTGWIANLSHDPTKRRTDIKNDPAGLSSRMRVEKNWIDDDDADHRFPVVVEVSKKNDPAWVKEVTLSASDNWWTWVGIDEGTTYKDYQLKETKMIAPGGDIPVDDRATPSVTTDYHKYKTTYNQDDVREVLTVTNKRIGVIDITVEKKWVDVGNEANRPGATLHLQCLEFPDAVKEASVEIPNVDSLPILDSGGTPTTSKQTVDRTRSVSEYTFFNLPKYDEAGKVIHYTVAEKPDKPHEFAQFDYRIFTEQTSYSVGTSHTDDKQAIAVTNQRIGTKDIEFHKQWLDAYAYQNGKRPDIYLTLWQKTMSADPTFLGFKDYQWTPRLGSGDVADDPANRWTATYKGVPKYDKNGAEITYYAQESMSANGSAFDYADATYQLTNGDPVGIGTPNNNGDVIKASLDPDAITLLKEKNTFVNGIANAVVIEGKKSWKNIPGGFPSTQLPKIVMSIDQRIGDTEIVKNIAYTTELSTPAGTSDFVFVIDHKGENDPGAIGKVQDLPKYDDRGNLYTYWLNEHIKGMPGSGDVTWESLYSTTSTVFAVDNIFQIGAGSQGSLVVEKNWKDRVVDEYYPATKFKLHRQHRLGDGSWSAGEVVAAKTLNSNDSKNGKGEVVFEHLLVFAPDGYKYQYYVTEEPLDGFSIAYENTNKTKDVELAVGSLSPTSAGAITNTYDQKGSIELKGAKKWNDYDNAFGLRPSDVTIELTRTALAQPGQGNAITVPELIPLDASNLSWDKPANANTWSYAITGLDRYAPNGMPWVYKVIEKPDANGYYGTGDKSTGQKSVDAATGKVEMRAITNSFPAEATVGKVWSDWDNAYKLRPLSVEVKLQVKVGVDAWADAATVLNDTKYSTVVLNGGNNWTTTFTNLPPAIAKSGTVKTCQYRFAETKIGDNDRISIQEDGTYSVNGNHTYSPAGVVAGAKTTITNTMASTGETAIQVTKKWDGDSANAYETRPLKNGSADKWEISFSLQRSMDGGATWSDVYESGSATKKVTKAIDGSMDKYDAVATFLHLPKYDAATGDPFTYRAAEGKVMGYGEPVYDYAAVPGVDNATKITNILQTKKVSGTKAWSDNGNATHQRPDGVTLALFRQSDNVARSKVQNAPQPHWNKALGPDTWSYAYPNVLPQYDQKGAEYTYTVEEASVPDGYWVAGSGTLALTNALTSYSLAKLNERGMALGGSEFTVEGTFSDGKTEARTVSPGEQLAVRLGELKVGQTYTVTETVPPVGYTVRSSFKVTIGSDGKLAAVGSLPEGVSIEVGNAIKVQDAQTSFTLAKKNQFGDAVSGATLKLQGTFADKTSEVVWATGNEVKSFTGQLIAGAEYTLSEVTVPSGYLAAGPQVLRITEGGQLQVRSGEAEPYAWTNVGNNALVFVNELSLTQAELAKIDENGKPFTGATFSLYKRGTAADGSGDKLIIEGIKPAVALNATEAAWSTATVPDSVINPDTGKPLNKGLANGEYYFVETATANDYFLNATKHAFTADNATNATVVKKLVQNVKANASLSLTKVDATEFGTPVEGTAFELVFEPATGSGVTGGVAAWTREFATGADGRVAVSGLPKGTYVLTEKAANANYQNNNFKATFIVSDACQDKELVVGKAADPAFGLAVEVDEAHLGEAALSNDRVLGKVEVEKQGAGGQALDGVTFELCKKSDNSKVQEGRTENGGKLSFENLAWGEYCLIETAVPDGYKLDPTPHAVTIGYGSLSKSFTVAGEGAIVNTQNKFSLSKFAHDGTTGLSGSTFAIEGVFSGKTTSETRELVKGAQSSTWIGQLKGGEDYLITETVPPGGYSVVHSFWVTMGADGTLAAKAGTTLPAGVSIGQDNAIKVEDAQNSAFFKKVDANDGQVVSGAKFELRGVFAEGNSSTSVAWDSTAEPEAMTGKLVAGNTYALTETAPAPGYVISSFTGSYPDANLVDGSLSIKMDNAGKLYYQTTKTADAEWVALDGNTVVIKDAKNTLSLAKKDADNNVLAGAVFTITGDIVNADGSVTHQTRSLLNTEDDRAKSEDTVTGRLVGGKTYTVHEAFSPVGYEAVADFEVAMNNGGTIVAVDALPRGVTVDADKASIVVQDKRKTGGVRLLKVDKDAGNAPLNDAEFTLYDKIAQREIGVFKTGCSYPSPDPAAGEKADDGVLSIAGLLWSDYYLQETVAAGYVVPETKFDFAIKATTPAMTVDKGLVVNAQTELSFTKLESYVEGCSDATWGAEKSDATRALVGAEFTAYADETLATVAKTAAGADAVSASDKDGKVEFKNLVAGEYWIKETKVPDGRVTDGKVYHAQFRQDGVLESFTEQGKAEPVSQVVNDVRRADIVIKKVAETDEGKVLPGSTYGLYKRLAAQPTPDPAPDASGAFGRVRFAADVDLLAAGAPAEGGTQLIAKATTDKQGLLAFRGVLMDQDYVIKELITPDGSLMSEKPIAIKFKADKDGKVTVAAFDGGSGTARVDESGNIVWREPQVVVDFNKVDPDGRLLAGAKLQVVDARGSAVDQPWTSSTDGAHRIEGKLVAGKTYQLVELEAPSGYAVSDPVAFTVENPVLGPDQNFVQKVRMVDQRLPAPVGNTSTGKLGKTSDVLEGALLGLFAVVGIGAATAATAVHRRRRGRK